VSNGAATGSKTNARRAAKRVTVAKAAAQRKKARQQRQAILGAAIAAVVIIVVLALVFGLGGKKKSTSTASSGASASSTAATSATPAALASKPTVDGSGDKPTQLVVKTLVEGTGPAVANGQTVTVNYVGVSMTTGKEFDSSWSRSQTFDFKVGAGSVIQGWDKGLVGVKVGSRVQLDIPADMAYGSNAPSSDTSGPLRFVVDVLRVS
jgi:peptidylprolyl isomerase